ncbi:ribosome-recycling factor, mitochondrial [[Candida] jaroonii]|uniref:Ribosome-recycling factor, mitochondrial n=1 Tax=[Candida] jaroonii TaxID=467808 RepID=A0ACA9Y1Q5_9ASCO|nr:ribosome-recycling factor, mitochondrial [[Candida] jaroonii]
MRLIQPLRVLRVPIIIPTRTFISTPSLYKPKKGKKHEHLEPLAAQHTLATEDIDLKEIETKFNKILDQFTKKTNEIKLGKSEPQMFDNLKIDIDNTKFKYTDLASTSIKGRNLVITVFDKSNNSKIISAILDSGLNLNPVQDQTNPNQLKIPLPPMTKDFKLQQSKLLKSQFERYKNGSPSLNSIRLDYKKKFDKKMKNKKNDDDVKQFKNFELLHKTSLDKLSEIFKTNEKQLLK